MQPTAIDALLQETRVFPPSDEFVKQANISDPAVYDEAARDYEAFWAKHAEQHLHWFESGTRCWSGTRPTRSGSLGAN
jgi:acetyl-CoA synthetase